MKVLDRFTGEHLVKLPSRLIPGRYCLLDPVIFQKQDESEASHVLLDDGSGAIAVGGVDFQFSKSEISDDDEGHAELAAEAIVAVAGKLANSQHKNVSPMLPSEIATQCELEEVEKCLADALRDGHLHAISDRPRKDLRYDELVAPVARARRMATSALSHLASHSDLWQQRTLSGVIPNKILARFSEDDYAIYENRLYKRLIDRLERHLINRLRRVRSVNSRLEEALEFQDSELTHFRVRRDICKLWGETFQDDNTGIQLEAGKLALNQLESLLRAILNLKQQGLYTLLPPNAVVPAQVHRTNILNHDSHYRHLPRLWEHLRDEKEDRQLSPEERLARQRQLHAAYSSYVGLVLKRAIERYECCGEEHRLSFRWAERAFSVYSVGLDWVIMAPDGALLRFVPCAWPGDPTASISHFDRGHVICWPGVGFSETSSQFLPISPLDLYVVERMGRSIDQWLLRKPIEGYGRELGPLPAAVKRLTAEWPDEFEGISASYVRLLTPLNVNKFNELQSALIMSANSQVTALVESAIADIHVLSRLCSHGTRITGSPPEFYCQCEICKWVWSLKSSDGKRYFSKRPKGSETVSPPNGFMWFGRDWLDIDLH